MYLSTCTTRLDDRLTVSVSTLLSITLLQLLLATTPYPTPALVPGSQLLPTLDSNQLRTTAAAAWLLVTFQLSSRAPPAVAAMVSRLSLLFSLYVVLSSSLVALTVAQPASREPDIVFREWDVGTFAVDPTAAAFYYVDEADSAIRAFSTEAGERLPYSWSFTDRFRSLVVDYRSRVCVLLQSNATYYVQQLDEQLSPLQTLKLDSLTPRSADALPMRMLADYTNQLWLGFYDSTIDAIAIDSSTGTQRSRFNLPVASASHYVWTLDDSLNLWVQQSDHEQQTYGYSSSGTSIGVLTFNHTTDWVFSLAVSADGAFTFAYSNDQTLVTFDASQQRLPRAEWVDWFADDLLTDLTWDESGHLLARAISGQSVLTISADGRELLHVWQSSVVSFARVHSLQYDQLSGDLFAFGSTEEQGFSALYRVTSSNGSLVQAYTQLPARLSGCSVQQVELSNGGNLWHLFVCSQQVDGGTRRWQELYVTDRSGRVRRQLRLDDKPYFTIYYQRFLVDDERQRLYIPYYNNTSKASVLNVYAFNLTLVDSLPIPFSFTSLLVVQMSLNPRNATVYFLTSTMNWINCTLYAMSLSAPPTPTPLFSIQVTSHTNQRAQYYMAYTRDDWRTMPRVFISVHTFGGDSGVYEYDEAQRPAGRYGWSSGAIDNVVAGSDGRLYGYSADRRRIVSWTIGGRRDEQRLRTAHAEAELEGGEEAAAVSVVT